mgnify:CR=1 FL=1
MRKTCNCERQAIKGLILKHCNNNNDRLGDLLTEIITLLESDCVCEKSDEYQNEREAFIAGFTAGVTNHDAINMRASDILCKQSQSPCEPLTDRAKLSQCEHERMSYLYLPANLASPGLFLCQKCGLVTCKDPSQ